MNQQALKSVPDNICIVMMSAVGDAVHVLPVINALKRVNPRTRITWVLQPGPATLVRGHRSVDDIIIFNRSAGLAAFTNVRQELAKRRFDLVINLQVYFKAGIVTAMTGAPVRLGFDRARARDMTATPAESYPRYSIRLRPSRRSGVAPFEPI